MKAVRVAARSFSAGLPPLPGLCGLQYLHTPDDFRKLVKKSITSCKKLRQTLSYNENIAATNPSDTLLILDQISNELCKVLDSAEFVRNLHEDEVFRDAAQGAFDDMSEFMHELNCDTLLYKRLDEIIHKKTLWRPLTDSRSSCDNNITISLSEEERVFAGDLYKEFISEGIHLSETPGAQDALGDLKANISGLETEFMRNINTPPDPSNPKWLAVGPFDETKEQLGNYSLLRNYLENTGIPQPEEEPGAPKTLWCLPIKPILNSLLASATSSNIRSQLYSHMLSEPVDNAAVLAGLVAERHRYARFLGHSCFSEKYLQDKILSTPGQVMSFLKSFSTDIRPQAEEELEALTGYYHDHCSDGSGRGGGFGGSAKPLNIWDIGYAIRHGRNNDAYAPNNQWVSRGCSPAQEAWRSSPLQRISGFLHVDNCLGSLEMLCDGLFGVKMQRVSLGPEEGWVCGGSGEQLVKYELVAAGGLGESLGFIYFDLFRRGHKFSNSAHFTVQCGCSNSDTDRLLARFPTTPFASASIMDWLGNKTGEKDSFSRDKTHNASVQSEEARYQLPTVVLVLNLSGGYLSLDELETLYHEFGHALHSLLSRTTFQYLSGTRGSTDFIEIPSHLFEYFARSEKVLASWARSQDGDMLPVELVQEALMRKQRFSTLELQTQLLYSVADQFLHGPEMGEIATNGHMNREGVYMNMIDGLCRSQREFTVLPLGSSDIPGMFPLSHGHLVNYSGGYYTYLYARQWAAQIWCNRFGDEPLSRSAGMHLWQNMLRYGASRDKLTMLQDLGSKPGLPPAPLSTEYYLRAKSSHM